jgi:D-alanyl-D-alanine carboxypeptidase
MLFACSPQTNEEQAKVKVSLQSALDSLGEEHHIPGAVLLVKTPGFEDVLVSGTTEFEDGKPITSDTMFGIGSITKTIISSLVLKLEAEGKLSIHDPIGQYFPQYPRWGKITIEQLLNMTSGIYNYMNDKTYQDDLNANFKQNWNTEQMIGLAYQHADDFNPGSSWNYTNTAYLLLGEIIAQVSKESVSDTLNQAFFKPYEMQHAYFAVNGYPSSVFNKMAKGYYNGVKMNSTLLTNLGSANGGMVMSANDLSTWLDHLFIKQDMLPQTQLHEMLQPAPHSLGKLRPATAQFGLGLGIYQDPEFGEMFSFAGVTPVSTAMYVWLPKNETLIIAMLGLDRHGDKDYDMLFIDKPFIKNVLTGLDRRGK